MRAQLPLFVSLAGIAVLFASIALVFGMVVTSLALGGPIDFPGGPSTSNTQLDE